jgi:hypothetical protein
LHFRDGEGEDSGERGAPGFDSCEGCLLGDGWETGTGWISEGRRCMRRVFLYFLFYLSSIFIFSFGFVVIILNALSIQK